MTITPEWQARAKNKANEILAEFADGRPLKAPLPINEIILDHVCDATIKTDLSFPKGVSAFSTKDMTVGWIVAINGREPIQRQRFSAAHELAHITLLTNQPSKVYCSANDDWAERLCDYFAGHLLMPEALVRQLYPAQSVPNIREVARTFKVSQAVAEIQFKQLRMQFTW
jgi:Zn-dependent peptidase ImmA (M78 family)